MTHIWKEGLEQVREMQADKTPGFVCVTYIGVPLESLLEKSSLWINSVIIHLEMIKQIKILFCFLI
jgi:hypothetical protein